MVVWKPDWKRPVYSPKCPVLEWSAKSRELTILIPDIHTVWYSEGYCFKLYLRSTKYLKESAVAENGLFNLGCFRKRKYARVYIFRFLPVKCSVWVGFYDRSSLEICFSISQNWRSNKFGDRQIVAMHCPMINYPAIISPTVACVTQKAFSYRPFGYWKHPVTGLLLVCWVNGHDYLVTRLFCQVTKWWPE